MGRARPGRHASTARRCRPTSTTVTTSSRPSACRPGGSTIRGSSSSHPSSSPTTSTSQNGPFALAPFSQCGTRFDPLRARFIVDLAREALTEVTHDFSASTRTRTRTRTASHNRTSDGRTREPLPVLTDAVHSLLASWAVAYFASRGVRVYATQDGRRVVPPPLEPFSSRQGSSRPDVWSDEEEEYEEEAQEEEEEEARRNDMYLPRLERDRRRGERARERRRERRLRDMESVSRGGRGRAWEVCFECMTPTLWTPGARPRAYGEPALRLRR